MISVPQTEAPPESPRVSQILRPTLQGGYTLLTLLAILVFMSAFYLFMPNDGLETVTGAGEEIVVVRVEGPAAAAGFQQGDTILEIDGRTVLSQQGPIYPAGIGPGDRVEYLIEREGKNMQLEAVMAGYLENTAAFAPLFGVQLLALLFWGTGAILGLFAPAEDDRARLVGLCWLLAGVTAAAGGPGVSSHFWGIDALAISLGLLGLVLVAAHLHFPAPSLPDVWRRLGLAFFGLGALAVCGLWLSGIRRIELLNGPITEVTYAFFLVCVLVSLALLVQNRLRARSPGAQRQTGIILWGTALGFGPFLVLSLLPILLFGSPYVGGEYTSLFLVLVPLAYAYVIYQRDLLRVDFIINRALVFFILVLVILFLSVTGFGLLVLVFDLPPGVPLLGGALALLIVLPSTAVQRKVQASVNRVLYGGHYDYASVTANLSEKLALALNRARLVELLTEELPREMGIRQSALLLPEDGRLIAEDTGAGGFNVVRDDTISQVLQAARRPLLGRRLLAVTPAAAQARWAEFAWGEVFVPLVLEDQLYGILVLGSRLAGETYSDQDLKILAAVAQQGALAAANVRLVAELRGLTQQLVRDDEAQRKALARDLHDDVLQNLMFVKQLVTDLDEPAIAGHLNTVIASLRRAIRAQRPAAFDQGLVPALQELIHEMRGRTDGPPVLRWISDNPCDSDAVDDERATTIYRIAQEALTNAIKHARADSVTVRLDCERGGQGEIIRLVVEDDGVGMEPDQVVPEGHYGLVGMEERARMIGGELTIESQPGRGTRVLPEHRRMVPKEIKR